MPDLSFESYLTHDAAKVAGVEAAFAAYAVGVMQSLGKSEVLRATPPKTNDVVFFSHGTVDGLNFSAAKSEAERSINSANIAESYPGPLRKGTEGATLVEPLTVVETSEPITLTQSKKSDSTGSFPVPADTHLMVFGDIVYIEGKIEAPGKHIIIVARELRTKALGKQTAELNVSASTLGESDIPDFPTVGKTGEKGAKAEQKVKFEYEIDLFSRKKIWQRQAGEFTKDIPAKMGARGYAGQNGAMGRTGIAGGDIYILCDRLGDFSTLTLRSAGGPGGRGQRGQSGGKGGEGGDGCDLANLRDPVTPFVSGLAHPPLEGTSGNSGGDGGLGGAGGIGGPGGNITVVINEARGEGSEIGCLNGPGETGPLGYGGNGGSQGEPGFNYPAKEPTIAYSDISGQHFHPASPPPHLVAAQAGDSRLKALQAAGQPLPADLLTPPGKWGRSLILQNMSGLDEKAKGNVRAHLKGAVSGVGYPHKLLETVRTRYLQWDAYRLAQDRKAGDLKAEMESRLSFITLCMDLLPAFLPEHDGPMRSAIGVALTGLATNLSQQALDYFGHRSDYVPLGSPDIYVEPFQEALRVLHERENTYGRFLKNLAEARGTNQELDETIGAAKDSIQKLSDDNNVLRAELVDLVTNKIPAAQAQAEQARLKLLGTINTLGKWVKEAFGLTPEDFMNCVFNLAFVGDLSPSKAGQTLNPHGAFTAFTTLTSQSATLINKAVNTLPDDEGQPVNRKHLLLQVDNIGKRITSLDEAWTAIQSRRNPSDPKTVALSDPDSYRLLVAQKDFDGMLERFSSFPVPTEARQNMDEYVAAIQTRNSHLLAYNTLVAEYLNAAGEIRTTNAQIATAEALRASSAQPDLNAKGAFLLALCNRTRDRCLRYCYLASRSYYFWTLEPDTSFYQTLKLGTPNDIDYNLLTTVREDLYEKRTTHIMSALSNSVQPFPPKDADYAGTGARIVFESSAYPEVFAAFKKDGRASFSISTPAKGESIRQNPFVAVCDVRLTKVRVWVLGVSSQDGMCSVRMRQRGEEVIQKRDGTLVSFSHEPVTIRFVYDASKVRWNAQRRYVENPDEVLQVGGTDGNLGFSEAQGNVGSAYLPLIGPFADWEIELADDVHDGLDRSAISAVCMEFHGFSQTAASARPAVAR